MKEIRFHGRGGQGAVSASNILAHAAFLEGRYVQAFLLIGAERRGAPVLAFTRIDDKPIRNRSQIYFPDYVLVLDAELANFVDVASGIKPTGTIFVNSDRDGESFSFNHKAQTVAMDVTSIALKHGLGTSTSPIVNTSVLGAFARISGEVCLDALLQAIEETAPAKPQENVRAAKEAYEEAEKWMTKSNIKT
ncbi:pyruvate ferredoxin oxidoreductase [Candidatus Poribacteria bacterium]|nr:pyruvate ferredoxin oxidoreductase [Candidatus Poribacteria bacterium]